MTDAEKIQQLRDLLAQHPPAPGGIVVASGHRAIALVQEPDTPPTVLFADKNGFVAVLFTPAAGE